MTEFYTYSETKLFYTGAQYPPAADIERLAKYERGRAIFQGRHAEIYERASSILADTPQAPQLKTLFIAVNIMDVLLTKPADLMVGDPPTYDSGKGPQSREQTRLDSVVQENDLTQMMHEIVIGGGYRGDSFIKTRIDSRDDFTETLQLGLKPPETVKEPIISRSIHRLCFRNYREAQRNDSKRLISHGSNGRSNGLADLWRYWRECQRQKNRISMLSVIFPDTSYMSGIS